MYKISFTLTEIKWEKERNIVSNQKLKSETDLYRKKVINKGGGRKISVLVCTLRIPNLRSN